MTRYYLSKDGQQSGPITEQDVVGLLKSGAFAATDNFREEGADSWRPLSGFSAGSAPAPGGPPASEPPEKTNTAARTVGIVILLLILLIGGCFFLHRHTAKPLKASAGAAQPSGPTPPVAPPGTPTSFAASEFPPPDYEKWFIENIEPFKKHYPEAKDDSLRNYERRDRALVISHALPGVLTLDKWVGVLRKADLTIDGRLAVVVEIPQADILETWSDPVSDAADKTLIEKNSDLYKSIRAIPIGSPVVFDFDFLEDKTDFVKVANTTVLESMTSPRFIVRFRAMKIPSK